ncbi:MAG: carboxypeptidase-like regulatory domain-containing protein [Bacteroidota bacterium]
MKTKLIFILISSLVLFVSCKKTATDEPIEKTTEQSGNVILCNDDKDLDNHAGVKVSIEGSDLSTITDSSGNWTLKGVKASKQTIVFEKDGFGTYKQEITPSLDHSNYMSSFKLPEIPQFSIKNLTVSFSTGGTIKITGEATSHPQLIYYQRKVVFIGKTNLISGEPTTWVNYTSGLFENTFSFSMSINNDFYQKGFPSGSTVYFVSYGTAGRGNYYYNDVATNKTVIGCLSESPSNIVSIQLP